MTDAWQPGQRYSYAEWLPHERRSEARVRARERAQIATLTDYQLAAWLVTAADVVEISWASRVCYRACRHEAVTVRGWPEVGNPKL